MTAPSNGLARRLGHHATTSRGVPTLLVLLAGCAHRERPVDPSAVTAMLEAAPDLAPHVLNATVSARACAVRDGTAAPRRRQPHVAVIDYSMPSTKRRLWVFDLSDSTLVFHEWVAHGSGSGTSTGDTPGPVFSDVPDSHCSSLGAFATAELYEGKHGLSLRLDGLQPGINGRARERDIVMHGADYVSEQHITDYGRLGRSWGCPAVRPGVSDDLVQALAGRAFLLAWHPDLDAADCGDRSGRARR